MAFLGFGFGVGGEEGSVVVVEGGEREGKTGGGEGDSRRRPSGSDGVVVDL